MPVSRLLLLLCLCLVALTLTAYLRVWECGFVDLDDDEYVTTNPMILKGVTADSIRWAWTNSHGGFWIPLTWMSLQVDASVSSAIQGPRGRLSPLPLVFHGQNLLWHSVTVILLLVTLHRLTGSVWRSTLVAALFAVHPLHVESVAWVTERKDVLSAFFWVLTLLAYGSYAQCPAAGRFGLVVIAFLLGLLAKPMLVTLPFVLLLLDWWPLGRWRREPLARLLVEKIPLFALAAAASVLTIVIQHRGGGIASLQVISFPDRLANAITSYGWYLEKTFWPTGLAIIYSHPLSNWHWGPLLLSLIVLVVVTVVAVCSATRWPWLIVGWLWFLGTLVPVLGLIQSGEQSRADRFVYIPHIGLFLALVWGCAAIGQWLRVPVWSLCSVATVCLVLLTADSWVQVGYWRNSETIWNHAIAVTTENHFAHFGRGRHFFQLGKKTNDAARMAESRPDFEQAVALQPYNVKYHSSLCLTLLRQEDHEEAAKRLKELLQLDPQLVWAQHALGMVQHRLGRDEEAIQTFRRLLEHTSQAETHVELGLALWHLDRREEAAQQWQAALRINPTEPEALNGLGLVLMRQGQLDAAADRFAAAVQADSALIEAWSNLGIVQGRLGRWEEANRSQGLAVQLAKQQLQTRPGSPGTELACYLRRLAWTLQALGSKDASASEYAEASRLDPKWLKTNVEQAWQLATQSDPSKRDPATAWELASQACQASSDPSADALDTLAASLASLNRFSEAVQTAQQAKRKATNGQSEEIAMRIALYRCGKAYVAPSD